MELPIDLSRVTLQSERLILRPWRQEDLADFYAYASVDGVGECAGWRHHSSIDISQDILNHFIERKREFALVLRENGRVCGSFGLHQSEVTDGIPALQNRSCLEIGYVLSKDYWGKGLMTEAAHSVIDFCFASLGVDLLSVRHHTDNRRSARVIEKCGFLFCGNGEYYAKQLDKTFPTRQYLLPNPRSGITRADLLKAIREE